MTEALYERRKTHTVMVGDVSIGSDHPIVIQSMITADTQDTLGAVKQIRQLHEAGAQLVRLAVRNQKDAENLPDITKELERSYIKVPLVADIHHKGTDIAVEAARHVKKVRINPGLLVFGKEANRVSIDDKDAYLDVIDQALRPIIAACRDTDTAIRTGSNKGSLSPRMRFMYGDSPEGMVQSVMEYLTVFEINDFHDVVISLKASDVRIMIAANRLMVKRMQENDMSYPLHLGVTEAGFGSYARIKSTLGIGTLLAEGIGDTIRVSLTEDPVMEIAVCNEILQGLGLKRATMEFISCPSCARTHFDIEVVAKDIAAEFMHLKELRIAVMGCIVNGPGENIDSDYGYMGVENGRIALFRKGERVRIVPQESAKQEMKELIKADGRWIDPL